MQKSFPPVRTAIAFAPYAAVGAVHVVSKFAELAAVDAFTKPLLMPLVLVGMLFALPRRRSALALLASMGIVFSWLGDVLLQDPGDAGFLLGLGAFLLAHIAYLLLIIRHLRMRRFSWLMPLYALWWLALVLVLAPHLGTLLVPVAVYGLVLGAMAAFAASGSRWLLAGGALFVVSDTVLGLNRFLPGFELWQVHTVIMFSYILAQGLIAFAVVRAGRGR